MKVTEIERIITEITNRILSSTSSPISEDLSKIALDRQLDKIPAPFVESLKGKVAFVQSVCVDETLGLFVADLTLAQMSAIARLEKTDETTASVLQFLLQGKPVWVGKVEVEQKHLKGIVKYALYKQIGEIKQQLESYGVEFYSSETAVCEAILSFKNHSAKKVSNLTTTKITTSKFITEMQLEQLARQTDQSSISLPTGSKLTPLAKDYARNHHISIKGGSTCY